MAKNILITGGAGYIGNRLVEVFLEQGHKVNVIDNFYYSQSAPVHLAKNENYNLRVCDARDINTFKDLIKTSDVIIPLACLTGAPICNQFPRLAEELNRDAIINLAKELSSSQKMIYPTTNSGYGIGEKDQMCDENSPLRPVSTYGILKNEAEEYLLETGNAVTFRLATVFGVSHRMRMDLLVNDFVYRAYRDKFLVLYEGNFRRNFLYIGDAVDGFIHAINNYDKMKGNTYNLGLSSANLTKKELAEKIKEHVPDLVIFEDEFAKDPDKRDYLVSNEKLKNAGFEAKVGLDTGVAELLRAYQFLKTNPFSNV